MRNISRISKLIPIFAVLLIVVAGVIILSHSRAATPFLTAEVEAGTRTSAVQLDSDVSASGSAAVKFTTAATSACAVATKHVPDGPDGTGGCWPGAASTGPNAAESTMAASTGSCTVNTANVIIDSKVVNCSPLRVGSAAANLIIKNSYVKGGVIQSGGTAKFTITDTIIDNNVQRPACTGSVKCAAGLYACGDLNNATADCGVEGSNFSIIRSEVMHTNRGAYCITNCTITDSYFHGTNLWPDPSNRAHASGIRQQQGLTLRHTAFGCDFTGPSGSDELGCSADLTGYPDFAPIKNNTIDGNLLLASNGNGFCAYGGGTASKPYSNDATNATNIVIQNNVFQKGASGKCGFYGAVTDFKTGRTGNVWSNNKYDDGSVVAAN